MTQNEFIQAIAPFVQKYAVKYGIKVASPIIAQACLQSAYGTSYKAKFHNYFGLKFRQNRVTVNNGYFTDGGSEQNKDGTYTQLPSNTAWYAFDSMEKGVEGYFQFINITNYANLKTTDDPLTYLQYIKADNYATSINYVQNVYNVITKNNLTQYDNFNKIQKESSKMNINIIPKYNVANTTYKAGREIKWIVLHYTAGTSSTNGAAANVASWFSKAAAQASADFIVDDNQIVQYNGDIANRYCWAVGGGKAGNSTSLAAKYYLVCQNNNSISIEMCSRKLNTSSLKASDTDWYLTEATINNAVLLTQYLMKTYNIDINHVIMHHMVTGKICPNPWTVNESRLVNWYDFLSKVSGKSVIPQASPVIIEKDLNYPNPPFIIEVTTDDVYYYDNPNGNKRNVTKKGKFTIIKVNENWGYLKSGAGWVKLNDTRVRTQIANNQKVPFLVTILVNNLRIRSGPGTKYTIQGTVNKGITYTIVEVKDGFGRLKSGAGWISLNPGYVQKK